MTWTERQSQSGSRDMLRAENAVPAYGASRNAVALKGNQHYLSNPIYPVGSRTSEGEQGAALKHHSPSQLSLKRVTTPTPADAVALRSRPAGNNVSPSNTPLVSKALKQLLTLVGERATGADDALTSGKSRAGGMTGQTSPKATKL